MILKCMYANFMNLNVLGKLWFNEPWVWSVKVANKVIWEFKFHWMATKCDSNMCNLWNIMLMW